MTTMIDSLEILANSLEAIDAQANEAVINAAKGVTRELTSDSGTIAGDYASSFNIKYDPSGYFVVTFTPVSDEVASQERGRSPYDMRTTMLKPGAPGVKTSRAGHLYRSVPLSKRILTSAASQNKSVNEQAMQEKIREVIANVKFQVKSAMQVGNKFVVEESASDNSGIIRVKSYTSEEDYRRKRIPKMGFVALRTISTNPNSRAGWIHPGQEGDNVQGKIQNWLQLNSEKIRVEVINELISTYLTGY